MPLSTFHAFLRVFADHFQAALGDAETVSGLVDAVAGNPRLRLAHALALFADQVLHRHLHVIERDLIGDVAHHVRGATHDR
jgi:hypothetical protein